MKLFLEQRWARVVLAAGAVWYLLLLASVVEFPKDYAQVQTAQARELARLLCGPDDEGGGRPCAEADAIRDATRRDDVFVVGYVLLGIGAIWSLSGLRSWRGAPDPAGAGPSGWLAMGLLLLGGAADVLENELLHESATLLADRATSDVDAATLALGDLPYHTILASTAKWSLLVAALLVVAWTAFSPPRVAAEPHPVYNRPPLDRKRPWDPPPDGDDRLGICCSGGGIRSAAFSLGALQALRTLPSHKPILKRARYLSAVSGGGYLAAGMVVAEWKAARGSHDPPASADAQVAPQGPPVFSPGSPEERHFRDNASYLVPDVPRGAVGVGRLLIGLVLNVILVWLVLFLIARPVGWAIGEVHPELRAKEPVALTRDPIPALKVVGVEQVACTQGSSCDTPEGVRAGTVLFSVDLGNEDEPPASPEAKDEDTAKILVDTVPFDPDDTDAECAFEVTDRRAGDRRDTVERERRTRAEDREATARPALVAVTGGKAEVLRQPIVEVLVPSVDRERCLALSGTLEVERQPELTLRSSAVGPVPEDIRAELRVSTQARVTSATGLRGREDVEVETWIWRVVGATTAAAVVLGFLLVVLRPSGRYAWPRLRAWARKRWGQEDPPMRRFVRQLGRKRTLLMWPAVGTTVLALGLFLLLIGFPWMVQELPGWLESASGAADEAAGSAGSGLRDYLLPGGGVLFLGVTALRRYLAGAPDTEDGRTKVDSPGPLKRIWRWLSGRSQELNWYELSPAKVLLGVLLAVSFVILFVLQMQYASANGPSGRLMGVAFVRDKLSDRWWLPDWQRYLAVLVGLVVFQRVVDAHAWSLQPFYKRRLSFAYLESKRSKDDFDDGPLRFDEIQPPDPEPPFPQLVVGCAVNLSEVGKVPPGRRAASFTFSSTEIGGPLVGYVKTTDYWERMRRARQKDITVPGAMAISGAAFSPAMGKKNLGPVGSIMAMANLRLGVWLPHPQYVEKSAEASWIHRPGWSYFLREVLNRYRFDQPYLYVSDGGHWENLGLVELLRRGCTEIVCINAGGDSQRAFGTIGEAIALAREELNVEFYDFDPTPLRPPIKPAESGRVLRREIARDKPEPLATASFVSGRFRYPEKEGRRREGRIKLIEPALTADIPFDVHVFAESEAIFPDDSTADQVFNHRQFEAFRALGYHQAAKLASDPAPRRAGPG